MKWYAQKMHEHCAECSECAANAIEHAKNTDASVAESSYATGLGEDAVILHHARVEMH